MLAATLDNLLINGDFAPALWSRLARPADGVECAVWRQTFAADRWKVRYSRAAGEGISQAMSPDVLNGCGSSASLELRGSPELTQAVFLGQRIEAAEASRYRRRLVFSALVKIEGVAEPHADLGLIAGTAREPDVFGDAFNDNVEMQFEKRFMRVPTGRWTHLECEIDARGFRGGGLSLEMKFPTALLRSAEARVRLTSARLSDIAVAGRIVERPAGLESLLAKRFFQRHDATRINSLGRALVVNAHELHFQFTFPEMRSFPACTLPHDNAQLRVFDLEGQPQDGFVYDVTYRSRGSVIVRATKEDHKLRDGFLSFVGAGGAILLEAEL